MAENLSWTRLVEDARAQVDGLLPEDRMLLAEARMTTSAAVSDALPQVQVELRRAFTRNRQSIRMEYPSTVTQELRREFIQRLNEKLPRPFYAAFAIERRKNDGYIIRWIMLPTE
jgi:hypothetical protein